jgi:hypothetical protein
MCGGPKLMQILNAPLANVRLVRKSLEIQSEPWDQPGQRWKRIHEDFAGPFEGSTCMWFIVVDARTKWPEVITMKTTTV